MTKPEQSSTPPATPEPTVCKHCGEEIRLLNGDWLHSDTHSSCSDGSGNVATPAQPSPAGAVEWTLEQWDTTDPRLVRKSDGYHISLRFTEYTDDNKGKFSPFNYNKGCWCNQQTDTSRPHKQIVEDLVQRINSADAYAERIVAPIRQDSDVWMTLPDENGEGGVKWRAAYADHDMTLMVAERELEASREEMKGLREKMEKLK